MALQTQQRIPTSTTPQTSFFRSPQQSSHFNMTSSPSVSKQQQSQRRSQFIHQQRRQSSASGINNAPLYSKTQQKEAELETQTSGRLTVLHSRLQQEAEKIRKWKNATELELGHKEKCLKEATDTIQNQQKNLTELQLQKESLVSKLQDEVANQQEIRRKIASTRDMCNALKDHSIKIDGAICKGQEDKDHLMLINRDTMFKYQELLEKFQLLEKGQTEWHKKYEDKLSAERSKHLEAENKNKEISDKLGDANDKILVLEKQSVEDKLLIQSLNEEIEVKTAHCDTLGKENDDLDHALSVKEDSIRSLEKQVDELTQGSAAMHKKLENCLDELKKAQNDLQMNECVYSEKLSRLETSLSSKIEDYKELSGANSDLQIKLDQTTTKLNDKISELSEQLQKSATELQFSREAHQGSKEELDEAKKSYVELEAVKSQMEDDIQKLQRELVERKEELEKQTAEKKEGLEKAEGLISDVVTRHSNARECWVEKEKVMELKIGKVREDNEELKKETEKLNNQLKELNKSMNAQLNDKISQLTKLEECAHGLTSEKDTQMEVNDKLKDQIRILKENEDKLTSHCSNKDQLADENFKLKTSLEMKSTEMEQLKAKMFQIQDEASIKSKELTADMEELKKEILSLESKGRESEKSHGTRVEDMKEEMRLKSERLSDLAEISRKEAEAAKNKLDQEKKDCEREVQDLVAALDSYRAEHERTTTGKDKMIENLNYQLQQNEKLKEIGDSELRACRDKVEQLESEIGIKNEELKELLRSIESMCLKDSSSSILPSTPLRKKAPQTATPQTHPLKIEATKPTASIVSDNEVSSTPKRLSTPKRKIPSTPKLTASNKTSLGSSKPSHQPSRLLSITPRTTTSSVLSTPARMYNYSATPSKLMHSTSKYTDRSKRIHHQKSDTENENQVRMKRKDNVSYAQEDDEAVFKKPKLKDSSVTVQRASSTTALCSKVGSKTKKQTLTSRNKRGKKEKGKESGKEVSEDLSWFDLDSVYGFGIND